MAKTPAQIVEEARKKNAAAALAAGPDTAALDELMGGIATQEAPDAVTPEPEPLPVTGVTTIEDAPPFVPPIADYAADAQINTPTPVVTAPTPEPTPAPEPAPKVREEEEPVRRNLDAGTKAEIEAGRKALEKYK